jgi:threonine/homoserine/homoserine lactone efflux protein
MSFSLGPNNLLSITNGLRYGPGTAVGAAAGRLVAFGAMLTLAAVGLGAVLAASELAFQVVKWFGVLYLAYLGWKIWRAPAPGLGATAEEGQPRRPLGRLLRQEFLVASGNPKAILIFTAILPQFIDPAAPYLDQFAILGATFLATESCAALGYGLAAGGLRLARLGPVAHRRMNRATGLLFLGFAAGLAASRRA